MDSVRKSGEGRKKERKGRRREGWRRRNHQSEKEREREGERDRQTESVSGRQVWACVTTRARRCKYDDRGLRVAASRRVYRRGEKWWMEWG